MTQALVNRKVEKRSATVRLEGRILFLTEDPELIKRQLAGEDLAWDSKNPRQNPKLRDDIGSAERKQKTPNVQRSTSNIEVRRNA